MLLPKPGITYFTTVPSANCYRGRGGGRRNLYLGEITSLVMRDWHNAWYYVGRRRYDKGMP